MKAVFAIDGRRDRPNTPAQYANCKECLKEKPADVTAAEWGRFTVALTDTGLQVFCQRHNINVLYIEPIIMPITRLELLKVLGTFNTLDIRGREHVLHHLRANSQVSRNVLSFAAKEEPSRYEEFFKSVKSILGFEDWGDKS